MSKTDDIITLLERLHRNIRANNGLDHKEKEHLGEMIDLAIIKITEIDNERTNKENS